MYAFSRRKPLAASCIAAAVQRIAIDAERHRFTLRQTRLRSRGVLRRTLGEAERMLFALRVDTDRRDQDQIVVHVNAVDLDHQQIEAGEIAR